MPQLDIFTYFTQLLGLFLTFTLFYFVAVTRMLPEIKKIKRVRTLLNTHTAFFKDESIKDIELISQGIEQNTLLLQQLTTLNQQFFKGLKTKREHQELRASNQHYLSKAASLLIKRSNAS